MKIKEGGEMDIKESKELSFDTQDSPKEVWVFDADNLDQGTEISHLMMSHTEQYTKDELLEICRQASMVIDQLRTELAKAQSVPEWFDYTKQSPQMDGNYQIFIKGEQITAKWVSRFGFADPIEGDALRQELITHWAMQPQSPKAQEPAND